MNVQNTEAWNVFTERSEQGVSAPPVSLARLQDLDIICLEAGVWRRDQWS